MAAIIISHIHCTAVIILFGKSRRGREEERAIRTVKFNY